MPATARAIAARWSGLACRSPTTPGAGSSDEIHTGEAKFCWRTSGRVSVFQTELAGRPCRVAFDNKRKQIVTFMTVTGERQ
jgi:hypothetical protein